MFVYEADGEVTVAYNDPEYLVRRHGIEGQSDRLDRIRSVLDGRELAGRGVPAR